MNRLKTNKVEEVESLRDYVQGMADATHNEKLELVAEWLDKLAEHMCAEGYIGCEGGRDCTADHK